MKLLPRRLTAFKIAWREARASSLKFMFVVLAVAVGVGALTGVRGFSSAFRAMLKREARNILAGDLSVRLFSYPTREQEQTIERLERRGIRSTLVTETLSMLASANSPDPVLVSVKGVDPRIFPFYSEIKLEPAGTLRDKLDAHAIALSDDIPLRLKIAVGDTVRLGGERFRVAGVIAMEPDRMSGTLNVGPRVIVTREGLRRAGLIRLGSRAAQRFLFAVPARTPGGVARAREELKAAFPEARIIDARESHPLITRGLDHSTVFLSLVSLIALIVGALGVGMAMHAHLQQKLDSIAIMKCIGARSSQVIRIYLIQTLMLGVLGGLIGIAIGIALQRLFPVFLERYFDIEPEAVWDPAAAVQGLLLGVLTTVLFTLPPLLSIRRVPPSLIFRRDMAEVRPGWRRRLADARASFAAVGLILLGIAGIALWLIGSLEPEALRLSAYFVGGIVAGLLVLAAVAWLLLRALQAFVRRSPWRLPGSLRHGLANLYRPGTHSPAVLTALGMGVMFTLTVYLVQHSLLADLRRSAPPGMNNAFLLGIPPPRSDAVYRLLRAYSGERAPDMIRVVSVRLHAVDGVPVEKLDLSGFARRYRGQRALTSAAALPEGTRVLQGRWWQPERAVPPGREALLSLTERAAKALRVKPGSTIEFNAFGTILRMRVAAVHQTEVQRLISNVEFVTNPGVLDQLPAMHYAGVRVRPERMAALERALYEGFPDVAIVNIADVLDRIQEVVDQVAVVVRLISAFTILAGVTILASSVAATRFRRVREVVILKTLGATRGRIARIFSAEFLIVGAVAGLTGSLLATGFSNLILIRFLKQSVWFDPLPNLVSILATALIAVAAGWLASFRILKQRPIEVLRNE
ncbi:MAG: FtsX-like permease family protein [Acidobacteria bacterium]|nr:FtsX-like permease family protein [Acidobacteriota bacterium]